MEHKVEVDCSCGCTTLRVEKVELYTDGEIKELNLDKRKQYEYSFQYLINTFFVKQNGIFSTIKRRLKIILYTLVGKEYLLEDLMLTQDQVEYLVNELSKLSK